MVQNSTGDTGPEDSHGHWVCHGGLRRAGTHLDMSLAA